MTDLTPKDLKVLRILAREAMRRAQLDGRPGEVADLSALLGKLEQIERELEQELTAEGLGSSFYWSSSTWATGTTSAWAVAISVGSVVQLPKTEPWSVWPVRGGQ